MSPKIHLLAIVGVGNSIAGDDGVGIEVIRRLRRKWQPGQGILLHTLEGDHFEIADIIDQAERFIFVDAVEGEHPGEFVSMGNSRRAFAPSFHQTDITAVMHCLEAIEIVESFPAWEIWGVTILPPSEFRRGLSTEVKQGVEQLFQKLCGVICESVREFH